MAMNNPLDLHGGIDTHALYLRARRWRAAQVVRLCARLLLAARLRLRSARRAALGKQLARRAAASEQRAALGEQRAALGKQRAAEGTT
jgi:hypothetical protein